MATTAVSRRRSGVPGGLALVFAALAPLGASGQCLPPEDSNEARLLAYYEAPVIFSAQLTPGRMRPGGVSIAGDLTYIPKPDPALQRTGRCFTPKEESTQLSPVFPRPRLVVALPFGLAVEGSYLPPLKVAGAQANLFSGALSFSHGVGSPFGGPLTASVRAHTTRGWVRGAITCARRALQQRDATEPCYGTKPSRDTFRPNAWGVEGMLSRSFLAERLGVYGGAGVNWLEPRFQVGFTDGTGFVDRTRVEVDLTRAALFAGAEWRLRGVVSATAQLYAVPEDVALFRLGLAAGAGGR
jgi:hypothetical protein